MNQNTTYEALEQRIKELESESTLRKEIQKNLLLSEKKWNSLLKGVPIPIYIWKRAEEDFVLTDFNDAAMVVTKNRIGKFIGHKASEMYAHMPEIPLDIESCFRTKKSVQREMVYRFRTTEKERILTMTCGFVPPDFVVIHTEDITDRKQAEQALKNTLDHLEFQVQERTRDLEEINHSLLEEIRAREMAQKKSRKNEERYRSLTDELPDVIIRIDRNLRYMYVNRAVERYSTTSKDRFIGKSVSEIGLETKNIALLEKIFKEVFDTGEIRRTELHHQKDIWFDWLFIPEKGDDGSVQTILASGRDITAIKRARLALEKSENLFRTFVDSSRSGIFIVQGDHFKYFNDTLVEISGYTREELLEMPYWKLVHPDMRDEIIERGMRRLAGEDPVSHYEIMLLTKEGKTLYFDLAAAIHEFEDKPAVFVTAFEITESKLAKDELRQSEEKYRTIIENIEEAYFEVDLAGNLTFFNDALCRIIGGDREELMGLNYRDFTTAEMGEKMFRVFHQVFKTGNPAVIAHYEIITRSNETVFVEFSTSLIRDKAGLPKGFRGIVRDNTEKLMAEKAKKELEHQLQQALRIEAIGTLAGGIAHDFNNLLTGIQGNLSILKIRKKSDDPEYKKILMIEELVQSGAELTRQLLGFAMGGKYEVKPCDVNEVIEKSLKMIDRTKKAITIEKKYEKSVWIVEADRGQIEQVLLNIFVNAAHAMPHGGKLSLTTENVRLSEKEALLLDLPPGKYVKISVADTGTGMDDKTAEHVFEPFFTTKEMGRGTGLGLASAYGIIKNHNGGISLKSKVGEGTTFFIHLPISEKSLSREESPEIELKKGRETILFVDDEKPIRDIGVELLSELGYQVIPAESGFKALDFFKAHRGAVDLVILDMIMPGMNGRETFHELRKINKEVKVLLQSGYSIDEQTKEVLETGGEGFIQKPFSLKEIAQKIRLILES
jgi:PAS domain S-box-containing protein